MSTEERDESQPRPRKVIPSIRRENTDQEGERRPYNQGYNRPEGNNYERRPYNPSNDRGGYNRPYGDNRSSYGERQSSYGDRPRQVRGYDNREGGNYNRPSYGNNRGGGYNNRPSYGNNRQGGYNHSDGYGNQGGYNRPTRNYDDHGGGRVYSATPEEGGQDGLKKRRPRVGDPRPNAYDNRGGGRPSYGNNRQGGYNQGGYNQGGYNQGGYNRRPNNNYRTNDYNPNAKYSVQKQLKYKEVLADPNEPIRLNKFLSNAGVCSRREADEFIQSGAVKVNDQVVTELGTKITRQDKVMFHDQPVQIESKVYIVLNKPKNCVTTSDDPQERLTVMDLVKTACTERIYPVGRLDRNTTGVLLLTNDGDLASKLTHPSFKKKKIYHVWLDKNVAIEDMEKIANGLELEDGEIHADAISYASEMDKSQVGIEIHSGRNRIVRRIFESLGYHVVRLDRVYFAGLTKKNLGRGKWRYLNEREVNALRMGAFE
ncbi:pseudouridine synthase [Parabacteroides sp. 52]|uniref:pseudouridine synthase n=1 Tax=unclassified Parabacteroides TaxID=2649774 RepID=UPI0013D86C72|nr:MULTISPECIES: pseudouridine synthase [unclassified Parabacteroides]MDH6534932.1 23S rRNA pseudouridine2605 synthase [Parabacteroides sp. PM5-20]NDV55689.1 pseudouridine synthase [Parabacteroides sp. 52]